MYERDDPNRSRGFGFVTFVNEADADAAKDALNNTVCTLRHLLCNNLVCLHSPRSSMEEPSVWTRPQIERGLEEVAAVAALVEAVVVVATEEVAEVDTVEAVEVASVVETVMAEVAMVIVKEEVSAGDVEGIVVGVVAEAVEVMVVIVMAVAAMMEAVAMVEVVVVDTAAVPMVEGMEEEVVVVAVAALRTSAKPPNTLNSK